MNSVESARITTIVDNNTWKENLASSWGISFYVETYIKGTKYTVLVDTSGSFEAFLNNVLKLGLKLSEVDALFISHWHFDHCGELSQVLPLLKQKIRVYVPSEDSAMLREITAANDTPQICHEPTKIGDGIMSTGEVPSRVSEHSFLINIENKGLVVLVGCSHPGIINILKQAQRVSGVTQIYAVAGGFHISTINEGIKVGEALNTLDVKLASPCHCTSKEAIQGIEEVINEKYVNNGSGKVISINEKL